MTTVDLEALRVRFPLPGLRFVRDPGGPVRCLLAGPAGCGTVLLQGAQLWSWIPAGGRDLLWQSTAQALRSGVCPYGGVPICWPWLGEDPAGHGPFHGPVRSREWRLESVSSRADGGFDLRLALDGAGLSEPAGDWSLRVGIGLAPDGWAVRLWIRNRGPGPLVSGGALHSFLAVGDRDRLAIDGLDGLPWCAEREDPLRVAATPLPGDGAGWQRNYRDVPHGAASGIRLEDPAYGRCLRVARGGSRTCVLWNPGRVRARAMAGIDDDAWPRFCCLETANILDDERSLPPGGEHLLATAVRCGPLAPSAQGMKNRPSGG